METFLGFFWLQQTKYEISLGKKEGSDRPFHLARAHDYAGAFGSATSFSTRSTA